MKIGQEWSPHLSANSLANSHNGKANIKEKPLPRSTLRTEIQSQGYFTIHTVAEETDDHHDLPTFGFDMS